MESWLGRLSNDWSEVINKRVSLELSLICLSKHLFIFTCANQPIHRTVSTVVYFGILSFHMQCCVCRDIHVPPVAMRTDEKKIENGEQIE